MRRKRLTRQDIMKIKKAKTTDDYMMAIADAELKLGRRLTVEDLKK